MVNYIEVLIIKMTIFKPPFIDMVSSLIDLPLKLKVEYSNQQLAKLFVVLT